MNGRKNPEGKESPEFIRVVYDEKGNAIAVKPSDGHVLPESKSGVGTSNGGLPSSNFIPYPVEQWLTLISKNILSLKADLDKTQNNYTQLIAEIKQAATPNLQPIYEAIEAANSNIYATSKNVDAISRNVEATDRNVDAASGKIDAADKKIDNVFQRTEALGQQINEQKMMYKMLADQVNVVGEMSTTIAKEFSQQKALDKDFYDAINAKMRMLTLEMDQLNDTFDKVKTLQSELDSLRNDSMKRFSYIDEKVTSMHRQLSASSERTEGDLIALSDVVAAINERIAELNEKMNGVQAANYATPEDLQNVKEELMSAIEQNMLDRQLMIEEIIARTSRQLKSFAAKKPRRKLKRKSGRKLKRKSVRKLKKVRARKIKAKTVGRIVKKRKQRGIVRKRKIVRRARKISEKVLRRKLLKSEIGTYANALVIAEKKTQRVGRAVFDVAKQMNENVVMIMQDKLSEDDGFEPITYDAIDKSEAVFIVTNRKMVKNFAVRNAALKRRVFLVNKKLKFSEVKY